MSYSSAGKDLKIRSKDADRGKHAYEHNIVGEQTEAGPYGSAADKQPAAAGPRYLHVGDHVVVCSGHESEHTYTYRQAEEVSKGYEEDDCSHYYTNPEDCYGYKVPEEVNNEFEEQSSSHDYDKPEDAYRYKVPEEVTKTFEEQSSSHDYDKPEDAYRYKVPEEVTKTFEEKSSSHDYDKPEDVYGHKDPQEVSFAYRAKERVVEMWSEWKSSKVCWLAMGCGLLAVASVVIAGILATHLLITSDERVAFGSKLQHNGTMILEYSTPWKTAFYEENNSDFDEFIVVDSTRAPTYLPFKNSSVSADALPGTTSFLLTTDLNECAKKPCKHGTCQDKDGGYKCTCSPGWTGHNCQQDIDECTKNPCQHGRCVNQDGGYKCTCSPGWTGQNCQQDIDECTGNPCQHGRCVNQDGGYKCTCSPGWTGQNCQNSLQCPSEWRKYNNHCYKLMTDKLSWSAASSRCRQHGAMLISINDQAENNFVKDLISNYKTKVPAIWMGLYKKSGQWKWTDGSRFHYKNWVPGEPNNNQWFSGSKGEYCAVVYSKNYKIWFLGKKMHPGQWNDFRCGAAYAYICEKPI